MRAAAVGLVCLGVLLASSDDAGAGSTKRSSAKIPFEATVADGGQDVALLGLVRVQTKVRPLDETVEVRATLRESAFLAYAADGPPPATPELDALTQRQRELRMQIAALHEQIASVEVELLTVRTTDVEPVIPGLQIDKQRAAELQATLNQLSGALNRAVRELADVQQAIESLLARIKKQQDPLVAYRALGKSIVGPSTCTGLACERLVTFALVRPDRTSSPFQVRLRLRFSSTGRLVSDETERGCETTLVCGVDGGECFCP